MKHARYAAAEQRQYGVRFGDGRLAVMGRGFEGLECVAEAIRDATAGCIVECAETVAALGNDKGAIGGIAQATDDKVSVWSTRLLSPQEVCLLSQHDDAAIDESQATTEYALVADDCVSLFHRGDVGLYRVMIEQWERQRGLILRRLVGISVPEAPIVGIKATCYWFSPFTSEDERAKVLRFGRCLRGTPMLPNLTSPKLRERLLSRFRSITSIKDLYLGLAFVLILV